MSGHTGEDGDRVDKASTANRTLKEAVMKGLERRWVPLIGEAMSINFSDMHVIFSLCIPSTWAKAYSLTIGLAIL